MLRRATVDSRSATAFAAMVGCALVGFAHAQPTDVLDIQPRTDFNRLDLIDDAFITRGDAHPDKDVSRWFNTAYTNGDGRPGEDEYAKGRSVDDRRKAERDAADAGITTKVKAELLATQGFPSVGVSVATSKGVVSLAGSVDRAAQVAQAAAIAARVKGVKAVRNAIQVK
jgi:hypothetical protein